MIELFSFCLFFFLSLNLSSKFILVHWKLEVNEVIFGDDGKVTFFFLQKKHWHQWIFDGFGLTQPSPLNDFQSPHHCFQWFFNGFGPTMRWFRWIIHLYWNSPGSLLSPVYCLFVFVSFCPGPIADSAQTEYCSTFHCPCVRHRRDISHFSHI